MELIDELKRRIILLKQSVHILKEENLELRTKNAVFEDLMMFMSESS